PAYRGDKLAGFVMFLRLDGEFAAEEMGDVVAQQIRDLSIATNATYVPFGLAPKQSPANTAWEIGENDEVTVVLYNRLRVEKRWKFGADGPTPEQIKEIVAATEEAITGMKKGPRRAAREAHGPWSVGFVIGSGTAGGTA